MYRNDLLLSLKSDTFNALCTDFDQMLRKLLLGMEKFECEEGTLGIKVTVKLEKDQARDFQANGYDAMRDIVKPTFKHEVSHAMQVKDKKTGSLSGNYELVWDRETGQYIMRNIDDGQVTLFDNEGANAIPMAEPLALSAGKTEEATVSKISYEELREYVGKNLDCVFADGSEGSYEIQCKDDWRVLLKDEDVEGGLAAHFDHDIICVGFERDGVEYVAITCDTCDTVLYMVAKEEKEVDKEPEAEEGGETGEEARANVTAEAFDWLKQFVGQELRVLESMGNYTVRSVKNAVVLSSVAPEGAIFHASVEKLKGHVGHKVVCVAYGDDPQNPVNISIECEDCNEVLFDIDAPSVESDGDYAYEEPGEEKP